MLITHCQAWSDTYLEDETGENSTCSRNLDAIAFQLDACSIFAVYGLSHEAETFFLDACSIFS